MSADVTEGADPEQLVEIAGDLERSGDRVNEQRARGRSQLGVLEEAWSGPDLEDFTREWPGVEQSLEHARQTLTGLGRELRRQAEEQVRTSAGGGGPTGSGTTADADDGQAYEGQSRDADDYGDCPEEVRDAWREYTDEERRAILEQKIREDAEALGIPVPDIVWDEDMDANSNGSWNQSSGTVTLNPDNVDDPMFMHTVAHEMRHALQHEAVEQMDDRGWWDWFWGNHPDYPGGATPEEVEEWEENFEDYKSPDDDFDEYFDQPVEEDARETGSDWVEDMTPEELDRLLEESG